MKKTLTALILLVCVHTGYAQWTREWSMGYVFSSPTGKMSQTINQGHGIAMDFQMLAPSQKYSLGADLNYSIYGYDKSRQEYMFPDGTTAQMDVDVSNTFMNLMAAGRYNLVTGKSLTPYVSTKAGYAWFRTDLNIYDPDDTDSCKPVETALLQKDGTWIYSIGAGVKYDLSSVFKKVRKERMFINLSANYTQGGTVNYMNTDAPDAHHTTSSTTRSGDVEAAFINTQTQVIHKHHVGYVYSSFAQMMDFRLSLTFRSHR
ncbi:MAG TPA: outer membrane beta-barrel protein [Cyclobacteriaceae bacterium]|nr:outer membrane beta-barrel protein [Cyclobacteriaceae bacterium]